MHSELAVCLFPASLRLSRHSLCIPVRWMARMSCLLSQLHEIPERRPKRYSLPAALSLAWLANKARCLNSFSSCPAGGSHSRAACVIYWRLAKYAPNGLLRLRRRRRRAIGCQSRVAIGEVTVNQFASSASASLLLANNEIAHNWSSRNFCLFVKFRAGTSFRDELPVVRQSA